MSEILKAKEWKGGLRLERRSRGEAGFCDACGSDEDVPRTELMACLDFPNHFLTLCPFHENMLLTKLLASYVKRVGKKKKGIFPILKSEVTEELNELPEWEGMMLE